MEYVDRVIDDRSAGDSVEDQGLVFIIQSMPPPTFSPPRTKACNVNSSMLIELYSCGIGLKLQGGRDLINREDKLSVRSSCGNLEFKCKGLHKSINTTVNCNYIMKKLKNTTRNYSRSKK